MIAAAEAGSILGAARSQSISRSSVTEAIRSLEDDLGVTLFDRQARGLLTAHKGSAFLRQARQILADAVTARSTFQTDAEAATGRLLLGVTSLVYRSSSLEGDRIEICDVSGDLHSTQFGLAWRKGAPLASPAINFIRSAQSAAFARPA